jgi:hypothetical protein
MPSRGEFCKQYFDFYKTRDRVMIDTTKVNLPFAEFLSQDGLVPTHDPVEVGMQPTSTQVKSTPSTSTPSTNAQVTSTQAKSAESSFITIVNTLPDPLLVFAEVADIKIWPSSTYRPDMALPKLDNRGTPISAFATKTICAELASQTSPVLYSITVGFDMPAQAKPDQIPTPLVFQFDQTKVFTNSIVASPSEDISAMTLSSLAVNQSLQVFVELQANEKGEPGVFFYVCTPSQE